MERADTYAERNRLLAVALPELKATDWLSAVGEPSDLPNDWGIWERDVERGLAGFEQFFRNANKFAGDLCHFIDNLFPMSVSDRRKWYSPFNELSDDYDELGVEVNESIRASGSKFAWWTEWTERAVVFDAKYYAVTRAFDQTEKIQDYHPLPDYYVQAFRLYQAGRFPCGWTRKFNIGSNRWKKGRFIYI